MTTFTRSRETVRNAQDIVERHVWGSMEYQDGGGAVLKVRGTDTLDEEVVLLNTGYGFNVEENTDAEVHTFAQGNDTNNKFGLPALPWAKQRKWAAGTGGVQSPTDPEKALEFNAKRAHVTDPNFAVGEGVLEVVGDTVYIRGNLVVSGDLRIGGNLSVQGIIIGPDPIGSATVTVPGFEA